MDSVVSHLSDQQKFELLMFVIGSLFFVASVALLFALTTPNSDSDSDSDSED